MNAVGRHGQSQRSGASGAHHRRQYSDNFLEVTSYSSNVRWDIGYYGGGSGGGQGSRMYNSNRNVGAQRSLSGASDLFVDLLTPPHQKKYGGSGGD
ncbi:hypothetical protein Hanom_Chr14g01287441 [Helianthus anomalus]